MEIKKTKEIFANKTYKYLLPCLKYYEDEDYKRLVKSFYISAVGLNDLNNYVKDNCIHILYNLSPGLLYSEQKEYNIRFQKYLEWIRNKHFYINDYIFNCDSHMIVIKIPEAHNNAYEEFIAGNYSKMYNNYYVYTYFGNINLSNKIAENEVNYRLEKTREILLKLNKAKEAFVYTINSDFDTNLKVNEFDGELDYPLKLEEEIFNY